MRNVLSALKSTNILTVTVNSGNEEMCKKIANEISKKLLKENRLRDRDGKERVSFKILFN